MRSTSSGDDCGVDVEYSVSTWQQPVPPEPGAERARVLETLVEMIDSLGPHRLRIAIDGLTASGKTSLGHELARGLAPRGRSTFRASLDDFKRPWQEADQYDRISGEGYYRNAFDLQAVRTLLLDPAAPTGDGRVALCGIDPLTQVDHSAITTQIPANGVLIVDGVFACRPELDDAWDLRIWVDIGPELSVRRGTDRDAPREGSRERAEALHRDRYLASELLYVEEVDPLALVEVVIENTDFDRPRILRPT
jgi:uridine kinase